MNNRSASLHELREALAVRFVAPDVRGVADLLAGHELEHVALQLTERQRLLLSSRHGCASGCAIGVSSGAPLRTCFFSSVEPRAAGELPLVEPALPDVDVRAFLEQNTPARRCRDESAAACGTMNWSSSSSTPSIELASSSASCSNRSLLPEACAPNEPSPATSCTSTTKVR